jgi:hypothetical protein
MKIKSMCASLVKNFGGAKVKTFKLKVTGTGIDDFNIEYNYSTNFGFNFDTCKYEGSEQERYDKFLVDLKTNGESGPVNIKVNMTTQNTGRGFKKNDILEIKDVKAFIERLAR